ncbi:MAG: NYN domain-containing protein [Candidatus Pseudobacter hemicellulosilyticus]|uniref:NYN domain-containing protein n=1 Tax=Candidatus Pseudobacter hemicellulosilyticus TaxID=3121375 RepID=A0AAJ5WQ73_9BACT|nr:MAG: NYN domain-containing protein [Pseudobacter sp.]
MRRDVQTVAVLIDGGFFLKRYFSLVNPSRTHSPEEVAENLYNIALEHVRDNHLYRIFYYDCKPFDKRVHHPVSKKSLDFRKSALYSFKTAFFDALRRKRKIALRMGMLKDSKNWLLKPGLAKELVQGSVSVADLKEEDLHYELRQKGVDMKIGIDIALLAFKKLVTQIVLIGGDADFVPASKVARREGVDFILDPMWNNVDDSMIDHIDGLQSIIPLSRSANTPPSENRIP